MVLVVHLAEVFVIVSRPPVSPSFLFKIPPKINLPFDPSHNTQPAGALLAFQATIVPGGNKFDNPFDNPFDEFNILLGKPSTTC